jgi:transposase
MLTGDGRRLPPFLRHDIERMIRYYEFICGQLAEVEADRKLALTDETSSFPHRDKVRRLAMLGSVGDTTATLLVAEVFHRTSRPDGISRHSSDLRQVRTRVVT